MIERCAWGAGDPLYIAYHDNEWGVPVHNDRLLFEFLCLEGAQAGLSWITILRKRHEYQKAFDNFEIEKVASYGDAKAAELLANPGIVRNRLKIRAAIGNAQCALKIQAEFGSLDAYLWAFVQGKPIQNFWESISQIPANTTESDRMSQELRRRGFKFVGSTICYAFMQACGLVNDHEKRCFRHAELLNA